MDRAAITGVLIDLDHTLWDFEKNSHEALQDIFREEKISQHHGIDFTSFHTVYVKINAEMWEQYRRQEIPKEKLRVDRFQQSLLHFNVRDAALAERIAGRYVEISPYKKNVFAEAHETLTYLEARYPLAIVTNGFNEIQFIKIRESGLHPYFKAIVTSEEAGCQKPAPEIFRLACEKIKSIPENTVMIGDDWEADMEGADGAGLHRIHFDPKEIHNQPVAHRIAQLKQLREIL